MTYIRNFQHLDAVEIHTLPQERRPQGLPSARIRIADVETPIGRRWAYSCEMSISDRGFAGPLLWYPDTPEVFTKPTRDEAVAYCVDYIRQQLNGVNTTESRRIVKWLDAFASVDMFVEPLKLADGTHDQALVPGVAPVAAVQRDIARVQANRAQRRGNAALPSGGLFDDTARAQLSLF